MIDMHQSMDQTRKKYFISCYCHFVCRKKTLRRLQHNQIFNQGSFFLGGGGVGGAAKWFGELCIPLKEILATPLKWSKRKISTNGTDGFLHHTPNYQFWNSTKSCISPTKGNWDSLRSSSFNKHAFVKKKSAFHFPFFLLKETVVHVREMKFLNHHISSKRQRWL